MLITGGENAPPIFPTQSVLASAELYDPTAGTFTLTGSLNQARYDHTATLLSNGTVLIAGGNWGGNATPIPQTAELYNITTGVFSNVGNLAVPRFEHTATLLSNGMVLIAGGVALQTSANVALSELYNPATALFTSGATLNVPRSNHTATLLGNGSILFAGGNSTSNSVNGVTATAELYEQYLTVNPPSLSFSNQPVGVTSAFQAFTFTNSESTAVSLTGISISGPNASDFAQTNTCGTTLPSGASCSVNVTFTPSSAVSESATVNISNSSTSPLIAPLSGTGIVSPTFSLSAGSSSTSITVAPGQTASYSLSLAGANGFSGAVNLTCGGAPATTICSVAPNPANISGTSAVAVTVSVSTAAATSMKPLVLRWPHRPVGFRPLFFAAAISAFLIFAFSKRKGFVFAGALLVLLAGCGGSSSSSSTQSPGTPSGQYMLSITATSGSITHAMNLTLTVN